MGSGTQHVTLVLLVFTSFLLQWSSFIVRNPKHIRVLFLCSRCYECLAAKHATEKSLKKRAASCKFMLFGNKHVQELADLAVREPKSIRRRVHFGPPSAIYQRHNAIFLASYNLSVRPLSCRAMRVRYNAADSVTQFTNHQLNHKPLNTYASCQGDRCPRILFLYNL